MELVVKAAGFIAPWEGLRLEPYHDAAGYPTIGYGRLLSLEKWAPLSKWQSTTEPEAFEWLLADTRKALLLTQRIVRPAQSSNQWIALTSFTFNLGPTNLRASTLLRKIHQGASAEEVGNEFLKWRMAGGRILAGLVRRRIAERDLYTA